jgi:hypothetical protein
MRASEKGREQGRGEGGEGGGIAAYEVGRLVGEIRVAVKVEGVCHARVGGSAGGGEGVGVGSIAGIGSSAQVRGSDGVRGGAGVDEMLQAGAGGGKGGEGGAGGEGGEGGVVLSSWGLEDGLVVGCVRVLVKSGVGGGESEEGWEGRGQGGDERGVTVGVGAGESVVVAVPWGEKGEGGWGAGVGERGESDVPLRVEVLLEDREHVKVYIQRCILFAVLFDCNLF